MPDVTSASPSLYVPCCNVPRQDSEVQCHILSRNVRKKHPVDWAILSVVKQRWKTVNVWLHDRQATLYSATRRRLGCQAQRPHTFVVAQLGGLGILTYICGYPTWWARDT